MLIAGCVSAPTEKEFENADYGAALSQQQCEAGVIESMRLYLNDAQSAVYDFGECATGWMPVKGKKQFGYFIKANINARNIYGAYMGYTLYQFLLRDGVVVGRSQFSNGLWFRF